MVGAQRFALLRLLIGKQCGGPAAEFGHALTHALERRRPKRRPGWQRFILVAANQRPYSPEELNESAADLLGERLVPKVIANESNELDNLIPRPGGSLHRFEFLPAPLRSLCREALAFILNELIEALQPGSRVFAERLLTEHAARIVTSDRVGLTRISRLLRIGPRGLPQLARHRNRRPAAAHRKTGSPKPAAPPDGRRSAPMRRDERGSRILTERRFGRSNPLASRLEPGPDAQAGAPSSPDQR